MAQSPRQFVNAKRSLPLNKKDYSSEVTFIDVFGTPMTYSYRTVRQALEANSRPGATHPIIFYNFGSALAETGTRTIPRALRPIHVENSTLEDLLTAPLHIGDTFVRRNNIDGYNFVVVVARQYNYSPSKTVHINVILQYMFHIFVSRTSTIRINIKNPYNTFQPLCSFERCLNDYSSLLYGLDAKYMGPKIITPTASSTPSTITSGIDETYFFTFLLE